MKKDKKEIKNEKKVITFEEDLERENNREKPIRQRIYEVVSNTPYLTLERVKIAIQILKPKRYAYILHDKDFIINKDGVEEKKAEHIHCVMEFEHQRLLTTIMKAFEVNSWFIEIPKGRNAFIDKVAYLTHSSEKEKAKGKYEYKASEVICNFDYEQEVEKYFNNRLKKEQEPRNRGEELSLELMAGKITLNEIRENEPVVYNRYKKKLEEAYRDFLRHAPLPELRLNFYIEGGSGVGKSLSSKILAHSLFPNIENEEEIIFRVGSENATFENYQGQPVIIWDDVRVGSLLKIFGDRGKLFQYLNPQPQKIEQNIKYGSVVLHNKINIFNSTDLYQDFLNGLAGEYVDRNGNQYFAENPFQVYRRFPFIFKLNVKDIELLIQNSWLPYKTEKMKSEICEYTIVSSIVNNIASMYNEMKSLKENDKLKIAMNQFEPMNEKINAVVKNYKGNVLSEEEYKKKLKEISDKYNDTVVILYDINKKGEPIQTSIKEITAVRKAKQEYLESLSEEEKEKLSYLF